LFPALALSARLRLAVEDPRGAAAHATTLLDAWEKAGVTFASFWLADAAVVLTDLGLGSDFERACAEYVRISSRWVDAAASIVAGDDLTAARIYATIGSLPDEAEAAVRAAEALSRAGRDPEASAALASALTFYRSVGATRWLKRAEALVAGRA
jgi:hypothetical protein